MSDPGPIYPQPLCTGMVRLEDGTRRPCRNRPMNGATVCRMHGGSAPQVRAAAKRRIQAEKARRHVSAYALPIDVEPSTALWDEVKRCNGAVTWLASLIQSFAEDDELKQLDMSGKFEKPSVWVEMYWRERTNLVNAAKACIDAGIDERRVQLEEAQGEQLAAVIGGTLSDVFRLFGEALTANGLSLELAARIQREQVPEILRRRLSDIGGAA